MLVLTLADRIVIYRDASDVSITLAPYGIMMIAFIIHALAASSEQANETEASPILIVGMIVSLICLLKSFINAVRYNRSWFSGTMAGMFKIIVSAPMLLASMMLFATDDEEDSFAQLLVTLVGTFLVGGLLWFVFVNGSRVYERRGWA